MNTKYTFIVLLLIITGCVGLLSQNDNFNPTDLSIDSKQSKNLIDRFNTLRSLENLPIIKHDTVLDNISRILLTDNRNNCHLLQQEYFPQSYRKSAGVYDEDSVRLLLYNSGIIDYQYEIQEIPDKDTADVFNSFFLADKSNHIRMGYYKSANRHILLKTKSYLKFDHATMKSWSDPILIPTGVPLDSPLTSKCYTDSIVCHFKILIPDQYYYQFYEKIPLSSEKGGNIKKKEVQMTRGVSMFGEYDFTTTSMGTETEMFLVILNKNNERIAVTK